MILEPPNRLRDLRLRNHRLILLTPLLLFLLTPLLLPPLLPLPLPLPLLLLPPRSRPRPPSSSPLPLPPHLHLLNHLLHLRPRPHAVRVQIRIQAQELPQLGDVGPRHGAAVLVHGGEDARDVGIGEAVLVREYLAADDGVEVVAAVPEGPFAAEVRGWGDGGGGGAGGVCGRGVSGVYGEG